MNASELMAKAKRALASEYKLPMTERQLLARDAKRDIGAELLLSVRQMKVGKGKVVARVIVPAVPQARSGAS